MEVRQKTSQRRNRVAILADVRAGLVRVLEAKPFNDVTVDELAREAGLSRTAFYFYYRDKNEVLTAVLEQVADVAHGRASDWWSGQGPPEVVIREALQGLGALWKEEPHVLRAAVEAASYDPAFAAVYRGLMDDFIRSTQAHLWNERAEGALRPEIDPDRSAEALIWMGERYHYVGMLSGNPPEETADVLTGIWLNALYPDGATVS